MSPLGELEYGNARLWLMGIEFRYVFRTKSDKAVRHKYFGVASQLCTSIRNPQGSSYINYMPQPSEQ